MVSNYSGNVQSSVSESPFIVNSFKVFLYDLIPDQGRCNSTSLLP